MIGTVEWQVLLFILGAIGTALILGAGGSWFVAGLLNKERDQAKKDRHELRSDLQAKLLELDSAFHAFQLKVAETYATKAGVGDGMNRVVDELKGLRVDTKEGIAGLRSETKDGLDKLGDRIERMENQALEAAAVRSRPSMG